jgi:hypothetical protein
MRKLIYPLVWLLAWAIALVWEALEYINNNKEKYGSQSNTNNNTLR